MMVGRWALAVLVAIAAGCGFNSKQAPTGYSILTAQQLQAKMNAGEKLTIVDLREPDLYRAGHIPGAANIPFEQFKQRVGELNPEAKTVFVCHNGPMGDSSASMSVEGGFAQVWNLKGGMAAWAGELVK